MNAQRKIGVLTSSRADFGIYLPLLKEIQKEKELNLSIIAFGTHLSPYHGITVNDIKLQGFDVEHEVNSMLLHDDENAISSAASLTMLKFADLWKEFGKNYSIVLCLGDRYEMFGAVYAGLPFGIKFAHLHGGETTLGAIDNTYRHAISLASYIHFVSTDTYGIKAKELTGSKSVYNVGALSLHNLNTIKLLSVVEMRRKFSIDFSKPTILVTVHPETVASHLNKSYAQVCFEVFKYLAKKYQVVITMPNADTQGSVYRRVFEELRMSEENDVVLIENFGTQGYFSAMNLCKFLVGNTSSGIIEAASFNKYVINLGDRQRGRERSRNVIDCNFEYNSICEGVSRIENSGFDYDGSNIYYQEKGLRKIVDFIKEFN